MREEIAKLVDEAVKLGIKDLNEQPNMAMNDESRSQFLDKRFFYWENLMKCLVQNKEIKDAYAGHAGSIEITWDDNTTHHNIVVEICLYGPLVAIYKYGPAPTAIMDTLYKCIEKYKLIELNNDEINYLETNSIYHLIF